MKILIVGGYGAMGQATTRGLAESPGVMEEVIALRKCRNLRTASVIGAAMLLVAGKIFITL